MVKKLISCYVYFTTIFKNPFLFFSGDVVGEFVLPKVSGDILKKLQHGVTKTMGEAERNIYHGRRQCRCGSLVCLPALPLKLCDFGQMASPLCASVFSPATIAVPLSWDGWTIQCTMKGPGT